MKRGRIHAIILALGDFVVLYFSLYLAFFWRKLSLPDTELYISLITPFFFLFLAWILLLFIFDFYEANIFKDKAQFLKRLTLFTVFSLFLGTAYFYLQPQLQLTPRAILILTTVNAAILLSLWRYIFSFSYGNLLQRVVVVGSCPEAEEIVDKNLKNLGYEIVAVFTKKEVVTDKVIRTFGELEEAAKSADIAVLTPEVREDKGFVKNIFKTLPLKIKYVEFASFYEDVTRKIPLYSVDELWFLENISSPDKKLLRRSADMVISLIGVTITLALFPFIATAIKLNSSGPVIYKQERVGEEGKSFTLYKFRTMHEGKAQLGREKNKGTVTAVGKFLRATHMDELPQFYNILKGDIGVVGPRPEWVETANMFEKEIPFYSLRHTIRPGITGWAQLQYPASTSVEEAKEKFKYDLYYIKNRSLFLDVIIVLKTLRTIF